VVMKKRVLVGEEGTVGRLFGMRANSRTGIGEEKAALYKDLQYIFIATYTHYSGVVVVMLLLYVKC
jgi:hypothetical protein